MDILHEILLTIFYVFSFLQAYRIAMLVIGLFPAKKFKPTKKQYKYAIYITARNEEKTIVQLVESIKKQDYPAELITTFVVAHNCKDKTAELARNAGAIVYEYNNKKENRKGFALRYLFKQIKKDYATQEQRNGILTFDGYVNLDADNLLNYNFMTKINDAFDNKKYDGFVAYRNIKNFGTTFISSLSGIMSYGSTLGWERPRTTLGLSTILRTSGGVYRSHLFADGFKWTMLVEDWEAGLEMMSKGARVTMVEQAEFYDEQPQSFKILARQWCRWANGFFFVYFKCLPLMLWGLIFPYNKNAPKRKRTFAQTLENETFKRLSIVEIMVTQAPVWILSFIYFFWYPLAALIYNQFADGNFDFRPLVTLLISYYLVRTITEFITNVIIVVREHRRIRVGFKVIVYIFFWSIVRMVFDFISFFALFIRIKWKPIPRYDTSTIEQCEAEKTIAQRIYGGTEKVDGGGGKS